MEYPVSHAAAQRWPEQIVRILADVQRHGVALDPRAAEGLLCYCHELSRWNDRSGLVSPHDLPFLVEKHIAASLGPLLLAEPRPGDRWIDVGTGAGLPGMVIKLCRPELQMTLLDANRKKTLFLEHVIENLPAVYREGLCVMEQRAEQLCDDGYRVILMRAVGALSKSLPYLKGIAPAGIRLVTFKGERLDEELAAAHARMKRLGWVIEARRGIPWAKPTLLCLKRIETIPAPRAPSASEE
jgi:16S rRNA (guanine527-N7)-methyltransferase